MVKRALYHIAGVDCETLSQCPATDKLWASQLGFSLLLSFTVVLGVSFHATGYMISDVWLRLLVATVVALTVFMFDRALYQSDWFHQGALAQSAGEQEAGRRKSLWRFLRIAARLAISFGLAWVIALFLELAIFSDTIGDKIKRDHLAANQEIFRKIDGYETQLDAEVAQRRRNLAAAEALYRAELAAPPPFEAAAPPAADDHEQQIKALDAQEQALRNELRQIGEKITGYAEDMNAEQLGRRLNLGNSGRAGPGPRYQFARLQKDIYEAQRVTRESELAQLRARREELRAIQTRMAAETQARRNQERGTVESRREGLSAQVDLARTELKRLETTRIAAIDAFRRQALAASDFQKQKDDPLSRMTAYQELKNDPKDGATITLFSWMTKFFVIFLEIVPVVAKMFFSPPSVYAARIRAEVERGRERARLGDVQPLPEPEPEIEERIEEIAAKIRQGAALAKLDPVSKPGPEHAGLIAGFDQVVRPADAAPPIAPLNIRRSEKARRAALNEPVAAANGEGIEAHRRREMDQLIIEEMMKKGGARAGGRNPADFQNGAGEPNDLAPLVFSLQDDIPQKP